MYGTPVFWRETMKPGKFLIFEGRVVFVLLFSFIHLRLWTIALSVITLVLFWYFERKGVSANAIMRYLRSKIIGRKRSARGVYEERTAIDFHFECREYLESYNKDKPLSWLEKGKKSLKGYRDLLALDQSDTKFIKDTLKKKKNK